MVIGEPVKIRKAVYVLKCLLWLDVVDGLNASSILCHAASARGDVRRLATEIIC